MVTNFILQNRSSSWLVSSSSSSYRMTTTMIKLLLLGCCMGWTDAAALATTTTTQRSMAVSYRTILKEYNLTSKNVSMPMALSDHTANLVRHRYVYLAGGCNATLGNTYNASTTEFQCDSITDSFVKYDIVTNQFTKLPNMPRPRYRHVAEAIHHKQIWVVGGRNLNNDELIPQIDVFIIKTNTWITIPTNLSYPYLLSDQGSFIYQDYMYVAGGYDENYTASNLVYRIDTIATFNQNISHVETMASLQQTRGDVGYTFDDYYAYIAGGFTHENNFCEPLGSTERYSFENNTWEYLSSLEEPRADLVLVAINNNNQDKANRTDAIFAIGGERQLPNICTLTGTPPEPGERTLAVDDVEVYDAILERKWKILASLPQYRFRFESVVYNDTIIYTFGGQTAYDASCQCYRTSDRIVVYTDETIQVPIPLTSSATTTTTTMGTFKTKWTTGMTTTFFFFFFTSATTTTIIAWINLLGL